MLTDSHLSVIVVGAGISGLTVAYLMEKAGHSVTVLEKSPPRAGLGDGGLRIPPNMTRLLKDLPGAEKLLTEKARECAGMHFVQCNNKSSELMGKMEFQEELMNDLGCNFYLIPHTDLHEYLRTLCIEAGVLVLPNSDVMELCIEKDHKPIVVLKTGERNIGDIVIGADGKNSTVRTVLLAEEDQASETSSIDSGNCKVNTLPMNIITGATLSIPVSLMRADLELLPLIESDHWMIWMGNGTSICGARYGPELYVLEIVFTYPPKLDQTDDDWFNGKPVETLTGLINEYDPRIHNILQLAVTCHWNIQKVYDLPQYVSKDQQIVVIGDAAHAVHLNGTYNTAAAFEDAFTLGRLFSQENLNRFQRAHLLCGYQYIRGERTRNIELACQETALLFGLPSGRACEDRNQGLRITLDLEGANDETLERVWSTYISQCNYDARDEVDEWRRNWVMFKSYEDFSKSKYEH